MWIFLVHYFDNHFANLGNIILWSNQQSSRSGLAVGNWSALSCFPSCIIRNCLRPGCLLELFCVSRSVCQRLKTHSTLFQQKKPWTMLAHRRRCRSTNSLTKPSTASCILKVVLMQGSHVVRRKSIPSPDLHCQTLSVITFRPLLQVCVESLFFRSTQSAEFFFSVPICAPQTRARQVISSFEGYFENLVDPLILSLPPARVLEHVVFSLLLEATSVVELVHRFDLVLVLITLVGSIASWISHADGLLHFEDGFGYYRVFLTLPLMRIFVLTQSMARFAFVYVLFGNSWRNSLAPPNIFTKHVIPNKFLKRCVINNCGWATPRLFTLLRVFLSSEPPMISCNGQ